VSERGDKAERASACFIEPMLCLAVEKLPEGPAWQYEVKLDGYRAIGVRTKAGVELWSRNKRDFSRRFSTIARALEALPVETVLDGEIVAMDGNGKPSFMRLVTRMAISTDTFTVTVATAAREEEISALASRGHRSFTSITKRLQSQTPSRGSFATRAVWQTSRLYSVEDCARL
jgi:hypothetical protein